MNARAKVKIAPQTPEDNVKRRQIVAGARSIFLQHGFDVSAQFRLRTHTLKHDRGNAAAFRLQACLLIKGWF